MAMMQAQSEQGSKGGPAPVPPPGKPPMSGQTQMQELARVAGGGLLNRATGGPRPTSGNAPGVSKE